MDQPKISVTDLCRICSDPDALRCYLAGKPLPKPPLGSGSVRVFGSFFHQVAQRVSNALSDPSQANDTDRLKNADQIYCWVQRKWTGKFLRDLLTRHEVDSAAQFSTALYHFSVRLADLRGDRAWPELLVAAEQPVSAPAKVDAEWPLLVTGILDAVRARSDRELEIVDYKLTQGNRLEEELLQVAIYARLLTGPAGPNLYHGSLEYFLPHLHVQGVTAHELDDLYATKIVPVIDRIPPRSPTAPPALCAAATPPKNQEVVLGRTREAAPREVTLRLTELTRHTAVLGGSGIGKTTLACSLVEQVLILGVPVVLLDRKGDLSRYADPAAWQPQSVPPEQSARLSELHDALRIDLYTPGVSSARPLGIDLIPADAALLTEEERTQAAREAATGLGSMMGLADRPGDQPRIAVLARAVQLLVEQKSAVTLSSLIDVLRASPESLERAVGALDLQRHGRKLVERLQTLEIMKGELFNTGQEMLRVENLLRRPDRGKARLTVINTQGLNEATFFWLAQFLSALGRFAKSHPSAQLQLLVMIDEADRYLPANSVPITKPPLENLLRRGRSAGIGLLLATQSPGDLDYRCRENVRTWLVGLVKQNTALEKLKPMFPQEGREALDAVSKQRVGQFCLVADGQVTSFEATPNLIKTEQLPEGRVHELAAKAFDRPG